VRKASGFPKAEKTKDFIVFLFFAERLSLSAQQAAKPRFFHTFGALGLI